MTEPADETRPRGWLRRSVAWVAHAPGLWLFYRERIPSSLVRPNLLAVALTLAACAIAVVVTGNVDFWTLVVPWLVGHAGWGTYLAYRLPPSTPRA